MSDAHKQFPKEAKEKPKPVSINLPEEMKSGNWLNWFQSSSCDSRYLLMTHESWPSGSMFFLIDSAQFADSKRCADPTIFRLCIKREDLLNEIVALDDSAALGLAYLPQSQRVLVVTNSQYLLYDQKAMEGKPGGDICCSDIFPLMIEGLYRGDLTKLHVFPNGKQFCVVRLNTSLLAVKHLDIHIKPDEFELPGVAIVDSDVVAPHYLALVLKQFTPKPEEPPYNKDPMAFEAYKEALNKYEAEKPKREKSTAVYLYDTRKLNDRDNKDFLRQGRKLLALPNLTSFTAAPGGKWCIVTQASQTEKELKSNMGTLTVLEIIAGKKEEMPKAKQLAQFKYNMYARYASPVIVDGKVFFCPKVGTIHSYDPLTKMTSVISFDKPIESMHSTAMGLCLYSAGDKTLHLFPKSDLRPLIEAVAEGLPHFPRDLPGVIAEYVGFFTKENYPVEESIDTKKAEILAEINTLAQNYKPSPDRKDTDKNIWHQELANLHIALQKKENNFAEAIDSCCPNLKNLVAPKRNRLLRIFAVGGNQNQDEDNLAALMDKIRNLDTLQRALKK